MYNIYYCFLGGFFMTCASGGLNDKAVAGKPSVTRLTHNNYKLFMPSGSPATAVIKILNTSPMLLDIIYLMKAFMLA